MSSEPPKKYPKFSELGAGRKFAGLSMLVLGTAIALAGAGEALSGIGGWIIFGGLFVLRIWLVMIIPIVLGLSLLTTLFVRDFN